MTATSPPGQDTPPGPAQATNRHDFGRALRALRRWSGLTQRALEESHSALTDSTISDHERGVRLPRLEWLHAYVTASLRHRLPHATREDLTAEFDRWRAAWTRLEHPATSQAPAVPHHPETSQPAAPARPVPDPTEARHEQPPAAMTIGGDGDPTTPNASADTTGGHLDQAATPPHGEPHPAAVIPPGRRRRWVLGGAAAAVVVAAGVVVGTATGVLGNTTNTGLISPPPLVPGKTFTETVNTPSGARTYSKPHTLGGEWQRVPDKTNVQVSCEITAPSAPNVGLYWYRIATPPWNNQYYSPANSFLNGDPPDGSSPTHVIDSTVPECPH